MKQHILPSIVASVVACGAAVGFLHFVEPKYQVTVKNEQAATVSPAKAVRIARTTWPELEQGQIDALTAKLGTMNKVPVTIVCVEDAKCGDLALNLENSFESAHWEVASINSPMVPAGIISSSQDLVDMLNATAPFLKVMLDPAKNVGPGEYIAIGARP
jgi:hypothetical protein